MIRINLGKEGGPQPAKKNALAKLKLPPQATKLLKQASEDLGLVALYVVGAAVALLPQFVVKEYIEVVKSRHAITVKEIDKQIASMDSEIVKYSPFKKELESFEAQQTMVKERLTTIRKLQGGRGLPVLLLDAIGQSLPKRVWLIGTTLNTSNDIATMQLNGSALANEDISDFVDKLQDSVHFESVKLLGVSPAKMAGVSTKAFKIDIKSKPLAPETEDSEFARKP
jgi:type IV pilus assembly protein PilN